MTCLPIPRALLLSLMDSLEMITHGELPPEESAKRAETMLDLLSEVYDMGRETVNPDWGAIEPDRVTLNLGDLEVRFFTPEGDPVKPGGEVQNGKFTVHFPGIDPLQIKALRIPELNYDKIEPLAVEVEMFPFAIPVPVQIGKKD